MVPRNCTRWPIGATIYVLVISWFVRMYDAIMHERRRMHYRTYIRRTMVSLIYHIFMHVYYLHREIFNAECWEFRLLCDKIGIKLLICRRIEITRISLAYEFVKM